jgi:S1-C subfamily serine protease
LLLAALLAACLGVLVALGVGCGGDDSSSTNTVKQTEVRVVDGSNGTSSGLNAEAIFSRLSNGVVTVTSLFGQAAAQQPLGGSAGQGSGFVLDGEGRVATNAHVVTDGEGSGRLSEARQVFVQFADGNQVTADIVGFDPNADVALLKVDPKGLELVPLKLGHSSKVKVGEPVAAIGSPFGEDQSLSVGVVSATNRTIDALTDFQIPNAIQTDAAINRGNSGGPLLNARGEVIGINARIRSSSGGGEGVGFAVAVDTARRSLRQLRADGKVEYGFIGVSSQSLWPQLAERLNLPVKEGALVADVVKNGPAAKAGIKGGRREIRFQATLVKPGGDVITRVNGKRVTAEQDIGELISGYRPGDTVTLEIYRGRDRREVRVTLGQRPSRLR